MTWRPAALPPKHDHVGQMRYLTLTASCAGCGATWQRNDDGPWRYVGVGR